MARADTRGMTGHTDILCHRCKTGPIPVTAHGLLCEVHAGWVPRLRADRRRYQLLGDGTITASGPESLSAEPKHGNHSGTEPSEPPGSRC